jgi:hypothetical protein
VSYAPLVQSSDLGDAGRKPRLRNGEPAVRLAAGLLQLSELTFPRSPYLDRMPDSRLASALHESPTIRPKPVSMLRMDVAIQRSLIRALDESRITPAEVRDATRSERAA